MTKSLFVFLKQIGYFIFTYRYEIFDNGCLPLPVHFAKDGFYGSGFAFREKLSEHPQLPFNVIPSLDFNTKIIRLLFHVKPSLCILCGY